MYKILTFDCESCTCDKIMSRFHYPISDMDNGFELFQNRNIREIIQKERKFYLLERQINQIFYLADSNILAGYPSKNIIPDLDHNNKYVLILLNIDSLNYYNSILEYDDLDFIKWEIKNVINENCSDEKVTVFNNQKNIHQLFVLMYHDQKDVLKKSSYRFAAKIYDKINKHLCVSTTMAISDVHDNVSPNLYKNAKIAYDMRFVRGNNRVFKYENLKLDSLDLNVNFPKHKLALLYKCIETNDIKSIHGILKDIFCVENTKMTSGIYIRLIYLDIINTLAKLCNKMGIYSELYFDTDMACGQILDYLDNSNEIVKYVYNVIVNVLEKGSSGRYECKDSVKRAKAFIEQNYFEEFTVKDLANKYAVNPNYFSTIFKQETGTTVMKYVTTI